MENRLGLGQKGQPRDAPRGHRGAFADLRLPRRENAAHPRTRERLLLMRRTMPGVDLALAAACDRVRLLHERCPDPRPDVAGEAWRDLDAALDQACAAGDRGRALAAIARWERATTTVLARAIGSAGLPA
jgi:hypothetical protein